jgi:nitric oxide dioxygenase
LSALAKGGQYRISVKHDAGGKVSGFLHERLQVGDSLELFAPSGDFVLAAGDKPLVLISGGVGITPVLPMLEAALATQRPVFFIHSARNGSVHAFREWVDDLASRHPQLKRFYCYLEDDGVSSPADATGLLDEKLLGQWLPAQRDVDAYFLGPKGFMAAVKRHLAALGVPAQQARYEFFGPAAALE